jgi:PAS domain S-box-containing protein
MSEAAHRILVVEDQRLVAADIENTLKKLGYVVVGNVSSGVEAISASDQLRPELVLMDVRLRGEIDGIHAADIIRDRFQVPVVYLTAYADEETIGRARQTRPFGYLVKPFNERELRATIEIAFYTHRMERTLADERAKRHAAEEFRILVDGVRDYAIFMVDGSGQVTTWNSGAERLKGYTRDEIVGQDFSVFYTDDERHAGHPTRLLATALREGRCEDENWRVRKDGTRFWANVVITPIRTESGDLIGFAKVTRDLTERRRSEEKREAERRAAERSEQRMAILAEVSRLLSESLDSDQILSTITHMAVPAFADGVAVLVRDPSGEPRPGLFHAANPELLAAVQALQSKGTYRVTAPTRRVMETGRAELHPRVTAEWLVAQEADEAVARLIQRFGIHSTIYVPIILGTRPFAVITFTSAPPRIYDEQDLLFAEELARRASTAMHNAELFHTARTERERAEEAAALRERLVAVVGHDLRQPLAAIEIHAHLLRMRSSDPEFAEDLDGLRASSRRMSRMIDQILDFTRSRVGGGLALVFAPMDLRDALTPIVEEVRTAQPAAMFRIQCPELRGAWDRDRLEQVFSNLIGNALAHGDPTSPVTVTAGATAPCVWVEVHNEGPPIPEELQAVIFDPFRRGPRTSRSPAGLGLGLYISNEVVLGHAGRIEIRSTAAEGTTFRVVLPREARAITAIGDRMKDAVL